MSLALAAVVGAVVLASGRALAAEPDGRVHLSLPSCELPKLPAEQVRAAVAIELNTSGLSLLAEDERRSADDIEASVETTCAEDGVLELRATWGSRDGTRALKLRELPATARPRAVALALAELLTSLRPEDVAPAIEVELAEDAAPPKDVASPAPGPRPAPPSRVETATAKSKHELAPGSKDVGRDTPPARSTSASARHALTLQAEARSFSFEPLVLGLRTSYEFSRFVLGLAVLRGSTEGHYRTVTAAITYGYWEWRIHEFGRPDRPWFTFGPRLGLGLVSLTPIPGPSSSGTSTTDVYADLAQFCELWATLPPFRFGTQLEVGYALGALAYETSNQLASYGGPFASVMLEVTLLL